MLMVTGRRTTIVKELGHIIGCENIVPMNLDLHTFNYNTQFKDINFKSCSRYVLCAGVLFPKPILKQTISDIANNISVNMTSTIALCDAILDHNADARIVVMGSASGVKGSYDNVYAAAKAGVHQYVINKKLLPNQQIVALAPSIIEDSGMTQRRTDVHNLAARRLDSPKKRFITAKEIANMIHYLLYVDNGFITNTVINMTGGEVRW